VLASTGYVNAEAGVSRFDTLNDAVVSPSGTIYATDPRYYETPISNRIFRIAPDGKVTVIEAFDDVPRRPRGRSGGQLIRERRATRMRRRLSQCPRLRSAA
jgi:hypothetical protein